MRIPSKLTLTISLDNEAFRVDFKGELWRAFRSVHELAGVGLREGKIVDSNGNSVGEWEVEETSS